MKKPTESSSTTKTAARYRAKPNWTNLLLHVALIVMGIITLLPFVWMISTSLKGPVEVLSAKPDFLPKTLRWENYSEVFKQVPFARFYFNTFFVTLFRVAGQVLFAAMAGYAFARLDFPGRDFFFVCILAVLMVPSIVTLIPNFILLRYLGWLDSYQGLIIPSMFSAFGTFLMRQYFKTFPRELEEAAYLDGCNTWQVFWLVAIPNARASLAAFGVLVTLWSWNDFLWPLIITNSADMQMLSVGIAYFQGQFVSNFAVMMAASTLATLPMLLIFLFAQKQIIEGITISGIK